MKQEMFSYLKFINTSLQNPGVKEFMMDILENIFCCMIMKLQLFKTQGRDNLNSTKKEMTLESTYKKRVAKKSMTLVLSDEVRNSSTNELPQKQKEKKQQ